MENTGEFRCNVTCADYERALGLLGQLKKAVAGDTQFSTRQIGNRRPSASGNENVFCTQKGTPHPYLVGGLKACPALK